MEQRDFPPINDNTGTTLASAVGAPFHWYEHGLGQMKGSSYRDQS